MVKWLGESVVERNLEETQRIIENGQVDKGLGQLCQIIESLETYNVANRAITKNNKKGFFDDDCAEKNGSGGSSKKTEKE